MAVEEAYIVCSPFELRDAELVETLFDLWQRSRVRPDTQRKATRLV